MRNIVIAIVVIVILVGIVLLSDKNQQESSEEGRQFDKVPAFTLKDYDGNDISLSLFEGKIAVINSWAAWCPFCVEELKDFALLQEEFGDEIIVIAIDRAESLERTKSFTDELGVTDKLVFLLDPRDSFYKSIGGFSMPETLFVDGDGNIWIHKRGPMELEEMRQKILQILE